MKGSDEEKKKEEEKNKQPNLGLSEGQRAQNQKNSQEAPDLKNTNQPGANPAGIGQSASPPKGFSTQAGVNNQPSMEQGTETSTQQLGPSPPKTKGFLGTLADKITSSPGTMIAAAVAITLVSMASPPLGMAIAAVVVGAVVAQSYQASRSATNQNTVQPSGLQTQPQPQHQLQLQQSMGIEQSLGQAPNQAQGQQYQPQQGQQPVPQPQAPPRPRTPAPQSQPQYPQQQ